MIRPDHNKLLDEVLAEASPPDFQAALLEETLRHAGDRRRWRQTRSASGALVIFLLAGFLIWPRPIAKISTPSASGKVPALKSFLLVGTRTFSSDAIISSKIFTGLPTVVSTPSLTEIATSAGGCQFINDSQLLALLDGHPAALVRTGSDSEELFFANPEDFKKLLGY